MSWLQGDTDTRRVYSGRFWGWAVQVPEYKTACTACKMVKDNSCWDLPLHWDIILFISATNVMGSYYMEQKQDPK